MNRPSLVLAASMLFIAAPALAAPVAYTIVPEQSSVKFETSAVESIIGNATEISGSLSVDPAAPASDATGSVHIATHSLKSDNEARDEHMHRDALESEKYPAITVTATKVDVVGDATADTPVELEVAAILELHGKSQPITFHAQMHNDGGELTIDGDTNLLMTDYGIKPPRLLFIKVRDLTNIHFHIVARPDAS